MATKKTKSKKPQKTTKKIAKLAKTSKPAKVTKSVKSAKVSKAVPSKTGKVEKSASLAKQTKKTGSKKTSRIKSLFGKLKRTKATKSEISIKKEGKKSEKKVEKKVEKKQQKPKSKQSERGTQFTIDLSKAKPYMTPVAILFAGILVSCSLILSFSDYSVSLPFLSKEKLECDSADTLSKDCLKQYAKDIKLKYSKFNSCLDQSKYDKVIDSEISAAQNYNAQGTPFVVVGLTNGDKVNGFYAGGAQSYEYYQTIIENIKKDGLEKAQATMVSENYGTRDELIAYYKEQYGSQGYSGTQLETIAADAADSLIDSLKIQEFQIGDGTVMGNKDSKITIIEFSDFECPYCKNFAQSSMPDLIKNYVDKGEAKFVFRDYPLESIHSEARRAANAARCAKEQGKFWEYYDKLYEVGKSTSTTD